MLEVSTSCGPVKGFLDTCRLSNASTAGQTGNEPPIRKWLGLPYGSIKERWTHSVPPEPWKETRECVYFGPAAFQGGSDYQELMNLAPGFEDRPVKLSEDACLTLNVFAPANVTEKLPVMVWLHGGSLTEGSSDRFMFDPTALIRRRQEDQKPYICVTVNYRLGIFGWLSVPDLVATSSDGLAGNYGLRDCVLALEWVQKNIANFGGDPSCVTVFGFSAGACLSSWLLFSRKKLFNRAILLSASPATMSAYSPSTSAFPYDAMLQHFNISAATPEARLSALWALPAEDLWAFAEPRTTIGTWSVSVESGPHAIWKEAPTLLAEKGAWDPWISEIMTGTMRNEGSIFVRCLGLHTAAAMQAITSGNPPEFQEEIASLYPPYDFEPNAAKHTSAAHMFADWLFHAPLVHFLKAISANRGESPMKTFVYRLETVPEAAFRVIDPEGGMGASHACEIPLVFNIDTMWEKGSPDERMSRLISDAFVDFASTGNPGLDWSAFDPDRPSWHVFKDDVRHGQEGWPFTQWRRREMDLWAKVIESRKTGLQGAVLPG